MIDTFRGYNHNLRIGDGEFFDMKNMTSDYYPILSPRKNRGVYALPDAPAGLIAKDTLCYVDGTDFVMDEYRIDMGLSVKEEDCPKQLISMGAYVIIMPDRKYINTMDITDFGNIDASITTSAEVRFELCTEDGDLYENAIVSDTEPESPENFNLWIDTSASPHTLKKYSASSSMWMSIATTYIKISSTGIGAVFERYDGVTISGIKAAQLADLNSTMTLWGCGQNYLIVVGMLDAVTLQSVEDGAITIERRMPNMDFLTESGNRLWGCRYGTAVNGKVVNEIYASKLGDFKNWNCFMGLSTDSYVASCGTDGQFTGAVTHLGYPLFFKEGYVHKVYGNYPSNYQIQTTACRGVEKGSQDSLAIVNEVLYYKGKNGICAYDGSLPSEVSYVLGGEGYRLAVGGAHGNKYYVSMQDAAGEWNLFLYDTEKRLWHKEDGLHVDAFCSCRGEMYCIEHDSKKILALLGSGTAYEEDIEWRAETGEIGISSPDMKYVSRLTIRMSMDIGAVMKIFVKYDLENEWELLGEIRGTSLRSFSIPVMPRRCDHLKLKLEGTGMCKIYSITKTIEQGSELS